MGWNPRAKLDELAPEPKLGAGISRPANAAHTRLYRLVVKRPGSPQMLVSLRAKNKQDALQYARNRWPDCSVEIAND
jgi:hypothetical protein